MDHQTGFLADLSLCAVFPTQNSTYWHLTHPPSEPSFSATRQAALWSESLQIRPHSWCCQLLQRSWAFDLERLLKFWKLFSLFTRVALWPGLSCYRLILVVSSWEVWSKKWNTTVQRSAMGALKFTEIRLLLNVSTKLNMPSRLLESIACFQLDSFLNQHNLVTASQWAGFRKGRSFALLLLSMTEKWRLALDRENQLA